MFQNICIFVFMLDQLELVGRIFLVAWFITNFDPITTTLYRLEEWLGDRWIVKLLYPLQCFKCLTFWSVFIITQDIWLALLTSFTASIYDNHNN